MRKTYIQKRFELSLSSYESHAIAQARIADELFLLVKKHINTLPSRILEIGCGTGFLTRQIHAAYPSAAFFLNDLNHKAESTLPGIPAQFIPGDAEQIPFPGELDLMTSSSTFQWFDNLPQFMQKAYSSLTPDGYLIFSSFGPLNLREIKTIENSGLEYTELDTIKSLLTHTGFQIMETKEQHIILEFETPRLVLKHLKHTGVNAGFTTQWTKGRLQRFQNSYLNLFPKNNGVSLTYHPLYIVAKKTSS